MYYRVRIHEIPTPVGVRLDELAMKLRKYLEKKKAKEPDIVNGVANYQLRNGLDIRLFPMNGSGTLEMEVHGDSDTFGRSVEAMMKIYSGRFEISYLGERSTTS